MAIKLTRREEEISEEYMLGYSIQGKSSKFDISETQVKRHLCSLYKKRGVTNRVELMAKEIMMLANRIREMEND